MFNSVKEISTSGFEKFSGKIKVEGKDIEFNNLISLIIQSMNILQLLYPLSS